MPLVGIIRGIEPGGFVEPLHVFAVISCSNAQFVYDEIMRCLPEKEHFKQVPSEFVGNPRIRMLREPVDAIIAAAAHILETPCPTLQPIGRKDTGAFVSFSVVDAFKATRQWEDFIEARCKVLGSGPYVVYAYTYKAIEEGAALSEDELYPVKIGFTSIFKDAENAIQSLTGRIRQQVIFPEPVCVLAILRCKNGRTTETQLHHLLKARKIKSVGKEWFASNREEIKCLMRE
jgi:hypothetical protein